MQQYVCNIQLASYCDLTLQGLSRNKAWKKLWPDKLVHKQTSSLLGNLALLTAGVNRQVGNKASLPQTLAAYNDGPISFKSTDELASKDWVLPDLLKRHKKIMLALAERMQITVDFTRLLPHLSAKRKFKAGPASAEKTKKQCIKSVIQAL